MGIRVTNQRYNSLCKPEEGETIIRVDRTNDLLGNPVHMKANTAAERSRVIAIHRTKVLNDYERRGPIFQWMQEIAQRVAAGEEICLDCWCSPSSCHSDIYAELIERMATDLKRK